MEELLTSEDYEERALAALEDGNPTEAQVFASLALTAAFREAGDMVAEAFDVSITEKDDAEVDDDDDSEDDTH